MPDIHEGKLLFSFPIDCAAIKFDDTSWYRRTQRDGDKGMDILAVRGQHHWWIEVKDCMGYEADNLPRLSATELPEVVKLRQEIKANGLEKVVVAQRKKMFVVDEVAAKLHSTLVSLMAAKRTQPSPLVHSPYFPGKLAPYMSVVDERNPWTVVLVLTWNDRDFKRLALRLNDQLRKRLSAFGMNVHVVNEIITVPHQPWVMTRLP